MAKVGNILLIAGGLAGLFWFSRRPQAVETPAESPFILPGIDLPIYQETTPPPNEAGVVSAHRSAIKNVKFAGMTEGSVQIPVSEPSAAGTFRTRSVKTKSAIAKTTSSGSSIGVSPSGAIVVESAKYKRLKREGRA